MNFKYELQFKDKALKEYKKLDPVIREQIKSKLEKILKNPHIEGNKLTGELKDCYKIKLRKAGVRCVYKVEDKELIVLVLAIGKRDKNAVYERAKNRVL